MTQDVQVFSLAILLKFKFALMIAEQNISFVESPYMFCEIHAHQSRGMIIFDY